LASFVSLSSISPPSTRILPSLTVTVDSMERLLLVGPALVVPGVVLEETEDDSW
jgi:hypothetical protein